MVGSEAGGERFNLYNTTYSLAYKVGSGWFLACRTVTCHASSRSNFRGFPESQYNDTRFVALRHRLEAQGKLVMLHVGSH